MQMHIRGKHFKLPLSVKKQLEQGIEDDRNVADYIEVEEELLKRRL